MSDIDYEVSLYTEYSKYDMDPTNEYYKFRNIKNKNIIEDTINFNYRDILCLGIVSCEECEYKYMGDCSEKFRDYIEFGRIVYPNYKIKSTRR